MKNRINHLTADGGRPWIVAEIGVNHDGQLARAIDLIAQAAIAGADAVKFQAFDADRLAGETAPLADYQVSNMGTQTSQREMLRRLQFGMVELAACRAEAERLGIAFGCTPFDVQSLEMLDRLQVDFVKIGSGDANNLPLIEAARDTNRPVIVSTGMCEAREVDEIVRAFQRNPDQLALLHCVSAYPAPESECNIRVLDWLRTRSPWIGFSDHTNTKLASIAAVSRGAMIIEKHLTWSRDANGPDHACSCEPGEFADFISLLRRLPAILGDGRKRSMPSEENVRRIARKSLVLVRDLPAGHVIQEDDLALVRPGTGLPPMQLGLVPGQKLRHNLPAGSLLRTEDLEQGGRRT